jgi:aminopeptidase C
VCLVHDPRHPMHKLYTVKYLGNTVGGARTVYVNVSSEELLQVTHEMITKHELRGQ